MSNLTHALEKIVNWQQANYPERSNYRSGLTHQQIEELTSNFPFKLTKELYELYRASGGLYQDSSGVTELTPNIYFLSFERALEINEDSIELGMNEHLINRPTTALEMILKFRDFLSRLWRKQLLVKSRSMTEYKFDICTGFLKEMYYVICEEEEKDSSSVWVQFIGETPLMISQSLTLWIAAIAEGYETGGYYIDKDGYFDVNCDKMEKIFSKYNPELSENCREICY